jgi:hypothetical protein
MAILNNVTLAWVACDPERPKQYKGTGPFKWSVQISTSDKKEAAAWAENFGFKMTPFEGEDGKIHYKTSLSTYAFGKEDGDGKAKPNKPIGVMLMNGELLDPNTVGNGSIGNVSFNVTENKDGEKTRRLKGIQVKKLVKYVPTKDEDEFELSDDFEIIEPEAADKDDEKDPY